jgi:hypothetical protein
MWFGFLKTGENRPAGLHREASLLGLLQKGNQGFGAKNNLMGCLLRKCILEG